MLWQMAESLSCMQSSAVVMFSTRPRSGIASGGTHTNPTQPGICAGTVNQINGAPKI